MFMNIIRHWSFGVSRGDPDAIAMCREKRWLFFGMYCAKVQICSHPLTCHIFAVTSWKKEDVIVNDSTSYWFVSRLNTEVDAIVKRAQKTTSWWRHQMKTFSMLLAICAGNSPIPGEFPAKRPVTRSFDVFFDLRLNKRLSKQSWGWWFETLSRPLWRHCNGNLASLCYITLKVQLWRFVHCSFTQDSWVDEC